MTISAPQQRLYELQEEHSRIQDEMIALALEHELHLYIEGMGSLLLEPDKYTGKQVGEWFTSTDSCS